MITEARNIANITTNVVDIRGPLLVDLLLIRLGFKTNCFTILCYVKQLVSAVLSNDGALGFLLWRPLFSDPKIERQKNVDVSLSSILLKITNAHCG